MIENKYILLFCLLTSCQTLFAQSPDNQGINQNFSNESSTWKIYAKSAVIGHPYLFEEWVSAKTITPIKEVVYERFNYNIVENQLHFVYGNNIRILEDNIIDEIIIENKNMKLLKKRIPEEEIFIFMEVIKELESSTLLKKNSKKVHSSQNKTGYGDGPNDRIVSRVAYYLETEEIGLIELTKKNLKSNYDSIWATAKSMKLNLAKESHIIRLAAELDRNQ